MNAVLIGIAVKSTLVLGFAWIAALLLRRQAAAMRHLVWTSAAVALLALPFLSASLPSIHFTPADQFLTPAVSFTSDATTRADHNSPAESPHPNKSKPDRWRPDWALAVAIIWMLGAAWNCGRLLLSCEKMRRLRSRATLLRLEEGHDLARRFRIRRPVVFLETADCATPMTCGWLRPAIFLPAGALRWPAQRRRVVLLHELAHVRRGDVGTQILTRLAASLYWWNPLSWLACRQSLEMRERATDDLVLQAGTRPSDYASHLVEVARLAAPPAFAAIPMAQPSQLETRLRAILDSRLRRQAPGHLAIAIAAIAPLLAIAPVAAIHAQDQPLPADVDATIRAARSQNNFTMLDRAAEGFVRIGEYQTAQKLLEASLVVRARAAGEQSDTYADGLLKLGDLAWQHGAGSPKDFYQRAVARGDRTETARALLRLGILSFHDVPPAQAYFQRSLNADPKGDGLALAWLGALQDRDGNAAEAESLFSRALAAVKPGTAEEASSLEMYASFLAAQNRADQAQPMQARAFQFRAEHVTALLPKSADTSAKPIRDGIVPPTVRSKKEPYYSPEARALKIKGTVTVQIVVNADGTPGNVKLIRGLGYGLDEKAVEAIAHWRFNPGTQEGIPVAVIATIEVNFRLL